MSDVFLYILIIFAIIFIALELRLDIKNYKENYYSTENKAVIRINSYWHLGAILISVIYILLELKDWSNLDTTPIISNIVFCIFIILFMIDIPLKYRNKSKLYFYEKGISLPVGRFLNHLKLVSYDDIEEFNFEEYSKNKFWLTIKLFKSETINYRVNRENREKVISFAKEIIPEYTIKTTKGYKD